MSLIKRFFNSDLTKELAVIALQSFVKVAGIRCSEKETKPLDIQCVRLTKDHTNLPQLVTYWSKIRINKLLISGIDQDVADGIALHDASFLSVLDDSLAMAATKKPQYDSWLFFNDDVKNTSFFELQHCVRGGKTTKASFVIQADC